MCKKIAVCTAVLVAAASVGVCCRPVPVYAEDSYTGSTEWENWLDYWHSSLNVAIDDVTGGTFDADDLVKVNALQYAYASMLYQQAASAFVQEGSNVPSGNIFSGWYYRGNVPHNVTVFGYGSRDDPAVASSNIPIVSADDFSISLIANYPTSLAYPTFYTSFIDPGRWYYTTLDYRFTFEGTICSGIVTNASFSTQEVSAYTITNSVVELNDASYPSTRFVNHSYPTLYLGGVLKDSNGSPISNTRQQFVRASVSNSFPAFVDNLKQEMYNNYSPEIVDIIWTDPETPFEPIYPTGEYVTGIPKEWTVENPVLPTSPQMSIDVPDASLPDLSGLSQYTDGVGFWWSLTGWIMDTFGIREIVLLLIGLGVFAFLLYRLGAG